MMTRSRLHSKFVLGLVLLGVMLVEGRSAQAEPTLPIPVTGGQFTVNVNIQNGQVQQYGYRNNQLPTLLTPVGTIGLTNATAPRLNSNSFYSDNGYPTPFDDRLTQNEPVLVDFKASGLVGLNDGRTVQFTQSNLSLKGSATSSMPFQAQNLRFLSATEPQPASIYGRSVEGQLPPTLNYAGSIAIQVKDGSFLNVPASALSTPSSSSRFILGASYFTNQSDAVASNDESNPLYQSLLVPLYTDSLGNQSFGLRNKIGSLNSNGPTETLTTPDGVRVYVTLTNLSPIDTFKGGIRTGVGSGHVLRPDGQQIEFKDRLFQFDIGAVPSSQGVLVNTQSGVFYTGKIEPSSIDQPLEISVLNSGEKMKSVEPMTNLVSNLSATPSSFSNPALNRDLLASPLSSSRIFPEVGAFR